MTTLEQFTRSDVLRIVGITAKQLSSWERLQLIEPSPSESPEKIYSFRDLVRLRNVKQLTGQQVPAGRLRLALEAARRRWSAGSEIDPAEIRLIPAGRRVAVQCEGACIEPVSGQFLLDFGRDNRWSKVRSMPERSLEEWLTLAADCEGDVLRRRQAIEAYRNIVERAPGWLEPKLNLGTLCYEEGNWTAAAEQFRRAIEIAPGNPLAHFNLGSVLDDLGESQDAARHLEEALRLAPGFADAHYNLARIYEKMNATAQARAHWQRYLDFDPSSQWADYARQRLRDIG